MKLLPTCLCALFLCPTLVAQTTNADTQRMARLVSLGKLWGTIRTLHPDLATKAIDWDQALVNAIKETNSAKTSTDYANAVNAMLTCLGDPATRLTEPKSLPTVVFPKDCKPFTWLPGEILLVHLNDPARFTNTWPETEEFIGQLEKEIGRSKRVIFDLRPDKVLASRPDNERMDAVFLPMIFDGLMPALAEQTMTLPAQRVRTHFGFRGDEETGFTNGILLRSGKTVRPLNAGVHRDIAFLINDGTLLPVQAMALHQAGKAVLMTEGTLQRDWSALTSVFALREEISATYKNADFVFENGTTGCFPDAAVAPSTGVDSTIPGIRAILQYWASSTLHKKQAPFVVSSIPKFFPDSAYLETPYPSREFRTLAAIKFWTIIDQFSPYKALLDHPWEENLGEFIEGMERAKDAPGYQLAVQSMAARLQDSHGQVTMATKGYSGSPAMPDGVKALFGAGSYPAGLAMIEGRPVVTRIWGDVPTKAGFQLGDEILSVNGEDSRSKMDRIRPYTSASTPQRMELKVANSLLRGPLNQAGVVQVRRPDGTIVSLTAVWSEDAPSISQGWRRGPEFQVMQENIGYVDCDRISPDQIQPMLDAVKNTKAVILDMRGYPSAGGWQAAASFQKHPKATGYIMETPLIMGEPEGGIPLRTTVDHGIDFANPSHYLGKVIMLMDERSQSGTEHAGLNLETGSDVTLIGSPTSGANGDTTTAVLPGGLRVTFTGCSVRHADGRQLQRVGLQPHVAVRPTIKGLYEGRDEVLDRAIRFVNEGH